MSSVHKSGFTVVAVWTTIFPTICTIDKVYVIFLSVCVFQFDDSDKDSFV